MLAKELSALANSKEIQMVANSNETSKGIFKNLSMRKRFRMETDLRMFRYQLLNTETKFSDMHFLETFKKLEKLGVGSIVIGRAGKPTRFRWNYNLKLVAAAAQGDSSTVKANVKDAKLALVKDMAGEALNVSFKVPKNADPERLAALFSLINEIEK